MGTFQFGVLVAVFLYGTTAMLVPTLGESQQDMWISVLIGWAAGAAYVLFLSFSKEKQGHHPLARTILSFYALILAAIVTRNMGELLNLTLLPITPQAVLNAILVSLAAYAVFSGIEVISRLALPFMAMTVLVQVTLTGISVPSMNLLHLQPAFEHSPGLLIKEAIPFISFPFMETVVLLPLLKLVKKPRKALLLGVFLTGVSSLTGTLALILLLPPDRIQYYIVPVYIAVSSLPLANLLEAILVILWLQTGFLKLAVIHYIAVEQLGAAFKLNYRKIILPISILIISFSVLMFDNMIEMFNFAFKTYPYFAIPFQIGIPLYLIIVGYISNKTTANRI